MNLQAHAEMMGPNDQRGPAPKEESQQEMGANKGEGLSKRGGKRKEEGEPTGGQEQQACDAQGPQSCAAHAFMPFGMGERSCPGQVFAQVGHSAVHTHVLWLLMHEPSNEAWHGSVHLSLLRAFPLIIR
jgi:hypothetical protein